MGDEQEIGGVSVLQHLESEGYRFDEGLREIFRTIDLKVPESCRAFLIRRDGAAPLVLHLPQVILLDEIARDEKQEIWHWCGLYYLNLNRLNEALVLFAALYDYMLQHQLSTGSRLHKGMPLVRISECHDRLNHPALYKRYLMLTTCEDAITHKGTIPPEQTGAYFRMVWNRGMEHQAFSAYSTRIWGLAEDHPSESQFPEWILQELDQEWMTEYPSPQEAASYHATRPYVSWLIGRLGTGDGKDLERLAHYLLTCMPGCRAHMRRQAVSTDYDVVCTPEGVGLDFRTELGRYFICECKDWSQPVDFSAIAKFCRVLDSVKCSFGIIFSKEGITGEGKTQDAERELVKVFHQRGMVVVVINKHDLEKVASGASFLAMLREKYEQVRLDLARKITKP